MVLAIRCIVLMPDKDEIFIAFCNGIFNLHHILQRQPLLLGCLCYNLRLCCQVIKDNNT